MAGSDFRLQVRQPAGEHEILRRYNATSDSRQGNRLQDMVEGYLVIKRQGYVGGYLLQFSPRFFHAYFTEYKVFF